MINPIQIYGVWNEGYALDNHILQSTFLGYDKNGKEKFQNTRTELGELVYQFKYKENKSFIVKIIEQCKPFLIKWQIYEKIDMVIPVPPTNKTRRYQPVIEIAKEIAKAINKECRTDILLKKSNLQSKDGNNINGTIKQIRKFKNPVNILIVDDLYSTGATLNEVCKILKQDENVKNIYCLVMTKTKG